MPGNKNVLIALAMGLIASKPHLLAFMSDLIALEHLLIATQDYLPTIFTHKKHQEKSVLVFTLL